MNSLRTLAALTVCLFTANTFAQDLKLPPKIEGHPGEFLKIPAETAGAVVRWRVLDPGLNLFPMELLRDTKTAVAVAIQPGKFRVLAWTSIKDVPTEAAECLVIVGNGPGPAPPPEPPAPPIDDFTRQLQAALAKEPQDRPQIAYLSKLCRTVASSAREPANADAKAIRDIFATHIRERIAPSLPQVRGIIVRYLDAKLPTTPVPLTDELRTTIAQTFEYVAASLERINP
jgi:hypothetical protein